MIDLEKIWKEIQRNEGRKEALRYARQIANEQLARGDVLRMANAIHLDNVVQVRYHSKKRRK